MNVILLSMNQILALFLMGRGVDLPPRDYCPIETFAVDFYVPFYEDCPVDDWRKEGVHIVGIGFYLINKRRA